MTETSIDDCKNDANLTGLPWLKTWKAAYIFVIATFVLWISLLIALTEFGA